MSVATWQLEGMNMNMNMKVKPRPRPIHIQWNPRINLPVVVPTTANGVGSPPRYRYTM